MPISYQARVMVEMNRMYEEYHVKVRERAKQLAAAGEFVDNPFPVGALFHLDWEEGTNEGLESLTPARKFSSGGRVGDTVWKRRSGAARRMP